jgi:hypothetical protein
VGEIPPFLFDSLELHRQSQAAGFLENNLRKTIHNLDRISHRIKRLLFQKGERYD